MSTSAIHSLRLSLTATAIAIAIVLFLVLHSATTISATNNTISANKGWKPGVNYTVWVNNRTYVGYNNCSTEARKYYFICGTGGCFTGMNVSVLAHPLPSPAPPALAADHSSNTSAVSAECRCRSNAVMNFLLSLDTAVTFSLLALLILFHRR